SLVVSRRRHERIRAREKPRQAKWIIDAIKDQIGRARREPYRLALRLVPYLVNAGFLEDVGGLDGLVWILLVAALRREIQVHALALSAEPIDQLVPRHIGAISNPWHLAPCPRRPLAIVFPVNVGGHGLLEDHFPIRFGLRLFVPGVVHIRRSIVSILEFLSDGNRVAVVRDIHHARDTTARQ